MKMSCCENEDSVVVFNEDQFFPRDSVIVRGAVRLPGAYLRHDSMTVADLVVAAGGLTEERVHGIVGALAHRHDEAGGLQPDLSD